VRLLNRSTRRLSLTVEGERFLERARGALRALDEAVADVSQAASTAAGRVRISVGFSFGRRWVLPLLPALARAHPQLQIELDLDNRPADLVAEGYDIGIRGGLIEDSSLIARRICKLPVALLASPGYLRRAGVPRTVQELRSHACLGVRFGSGTPNPWRFKSAGRRRIEIVPEAQLIVSDAEAVIDLALADAGIVQAGLYHALPFLRSGRLKLLLTELHDPGEREMVLHYPHRRYLAPRVRVVVDALLAELALASDLRLGVKEVLEALPQAAAEAVQPTRRRNTRRSGREASGANA
jgi:DNA-binding transcriptional LysR family regulator